jgi:TetR/AcrR family transcriptional repressor of nem operon
MFLDKGLGNVGMRDVMAAADLTPGAFYKHFPSKDQLILEASREAFDQAYVMFERETAGKSPAQAIEMIVSMYLEQSQVKERPYVCPLAMLGTELKHSDPLIRAVAMEGHQRLIELIARRLTHQTRRKALITASGIISTLVGAVALAEIAPDSKMASAILKDAKVLINKQILRQ